MTADRRNTCFIINLQKSFQRSVSVSVFEEEMQLKCSLLPSLINNALNQKLIILQYEINQHVL